MRVYVSIAMTLLLCGAPAMAQSDDDASAESQESAVEESSAAQEGPKGAQDQSTGLTLQDRIRAVSNASFLKKGRFELEPFTGISVSDAFFRRWTVGARVGYHLLENLSLDIGGAYSVYSQPLDAVRLIGEVEAGDDGKFDDVTPLVGYGDIGVTFSPIYGKVGVMSEWVVRFDAFISGGIGAQFSSGNSPVQFPAVEIGVGGRFFINRFLALRGEIRDNITFNAEGVQSLVFLNGGVSIFFPIEFENNDGGTKIVDE